ncbi:MAG: fused MFS/spermidine synthase [Bryobacterales bacterium]|nr:fused MFS/spermidine synthase [Bryobacterales bacterium]
MLLSAATIFLSAFLLFQVQPMVARMILPWFGGSASVWTICMLFYQVGLLGGYLYAHLLVRRPQRVQAATHWAMLAVSLLMLPVIPDPAWKPAGDAEPTTRILLALAATIGLPYFILSATGPLVQSWFFRAGKLSPYRLYALSNIGSMLALLSYPIVVEPYLAVRTQAWTWTAGYAVFIVLCALAAWRIWGLPDVELTATPDEAAPRPTWRQRLAWLLLPACASSLLLSITNHLTQNVASVPFLWIVPLALYLLTFILCFDAEGWYQRDTYLKLTAISLASMAYALSSDVHNLPLYIAGPLFLTGLFVCAIVCHGELVRLKPHPSHLTGFYLMIAAGGALGGVFVGILAPHVFPDNFELHVSLAGLALIVLLILRRDPESPIAGGRWKPEWILSALFVLGLMAFLFKQVDSSLEGYRVITRNFYGVLKVHDSGSRFGGVRTLTHGTINHGEQYLDPDRRKFPTTYFGPDSGAGLALLHFPRLAPMRVGIIGLGTGTLASYGRESDLYRFYEINPVVEDLAWNEFYFLHDSAAKIDVILGDARLSLEREEPQNYDVFIVDAFSSDSIPVHLLTKECFELYFRHLQPEGILAVHVSNRYLDLVPVVEQIARTLGKQARLVDSEDDDNDPAIFGATYVLISSSGAIFGREHIRDVATLITPDPKLRLWTDDYSSLYRILKK